MIFKSKTLPGIRLDWRAYFVKFCEDHGGEPVQFKRRLLFQDGWTYSCDDYQGPEWPPPKDPEDLRKLVRVYWKIRLRIVQAEMLQVKEMLSTLTQLQSGKSSGLQQFVSYWDAEENKQVRKTVEVDTSVLKGRLEWLIKDIQDCKAQLKQETSHVNV